jgi:predicted homoserine dehydrogenase-like protein
MNRRNFMGGVAAGAATLAIAPKKLFAASDRIRYGIIGVGDRGQQDLRDALACPGTECVGVADIYSRNRERAKGLVPNATLYEHRHRCYASFSACEAHADGHRCWQRCVL